MRLCCYFQFKCKTTRLLLPSILYLGLFPFTLKILVPNDISIITYSLYPQSQVTLTLITENNVRYFWQLVLFSLYRLITVLFNTTESFSVGLCQQLGIRFNSFLHFISIFVPFCFMVMYNIYMVPKSK